MIAQLKTTVLMLTMGIGRSLHLFGKKNYNTEFKLLQLYTLKNYIFFSTHKEKARRQFDLWLYVVLDQGRPQRPSAFWIVSLQVKTLSFVRIHGLITCYDIIVSW